MNYRGLFAVFAVACVSSLSGWRVSSSTAQSRLERERAALAEPFTGVTTNGTVVAGLFELRATGVSTAPMREAARAFLASLTPEQRAETQFPVDDLEWRKWYNVHRGPRQGVSFLEMDPTQREAGYGLLEASLSAKGFEKSRNVMKLNGHLAQLVGKPDEYGEHRYYLTVMGEPSETAPWGFQLDGHHLVINYFVLGDQVVMTPTFLGSEPVIAESGKYEGTRVLQDEQDKGLALMTSLDEHQRRAALLEAKKERGNARAAQFRDNLVLAYEGIRATELHESQKSLLLDIVREYVFNMDEGHAKIRMAEIEKHLSDTYFAWIGETGPDAVFYYRIHGPVILIEFDHQGPIALEGPKVPSRRHVHSVVRTPNGNDYGKDLLRQHYEAHRGDPTHGHVQDHPDR